MSILSKITTFVIMKLSEVYCRNWYNIRCRLFRRIDDFDYHISQLENTDGLPFFNKVVEVNNLYEKTQSVKILIDNGFYINKISKDLSGKDRCIVSTKL